MQEHHVTAPGPVLDRHGAGDQRPARLCGARREQLVKYAERNAAEMPAAFLSYIKM